MSAVGVTGVNLAWGGVGNTKELGCRGIADVVPVLGLRTPC